MKTKTIIQSIFVAVAVAGLGLSAAFANDQSQLRAKITKAEAQKIAMAKVPDGVIKDSELEEEGGKLIWSFDIARPGSKNITEVNVNAITGAAHIEIETPADLAKEAKEDAAKGKSEKK